MAATLRGIWVLRVQPGVRAEAGESTVLLFRRYGTVETRCRTEQGAAFVALPEPAAFCARFARLVQSQVRPQDDPAFVQGDVVPLRNVCTMAGGIWPVCWLARDDVFFVAVPAVTRAELADKKPSAIMFVSHDPLSVHSHKHTFTPAASFASEQAVPLHCLWCAGRRDAPC